ncbi:hypothetical protein L1987_85737 [Smallanthus sonchifolius]|uniref:Uncharacterized protein n=1 Tax=Smallanthus sonchifolius TaxID=185202 RepID=A0ACB8XXG0_9ASTR|nr:hypothetical protein L1987_85737 [Smallanthus sonchifolius]
MSGPECCTNPPVMNSSFGNGSVEEIGGLKSYSTGDRSSNHGILVGSDAFGYEGVMLRKLADKISSLGYLVVVPDFFFGDCIYITSPPEVRADWLINHSPEKGCENAWKIIGELKRKGVYAVGAAGFCWGGMMVAKLAKYNEIKAAVILYPCRFTDNDVNGLFLLDVVESYVKIFLGVGHGWASRYSENDESAVRSAEEAHYDMLN